MFSRWPLASEGLCLLCARLTSFFHRRSGLFKTLSFLLILFFHSFLSRKANFLFDLFSLVHLLHLNMYHFSVVVLLTAMFLFTCVEFTAVLYFSNLEQPCNFTAVYSRSPLNSHVRDFDHSVKRKPENR